MVYIHAIHMESNTDPTIAGSREESIKMDSRRDPAIAGPKERSTTRYYSVTTLYYKVLLQYYSVLQSTTPVLLCTAKYYSNTTPVQCAEQAKSPSNLTKYCTCHEILSSPAASETFPVPPCKTHFVWKNTTFRAPAIYQNFTKCCACHKK